MSSGQGKYKQEDITTYLIESQNQNTDNTNDVI